MAPRDSVQITEFLRLYRLKKFDSERRTDNFQYEHPINHLALMLDNQTSSLGDAVERYCAYIIGSYAGAFVCAHILERMTAGTAQQNQTYNNWDP